MSVNVSLVIWEELESGKRVLETNLVVVNEPDLYELPLIAATLGRDLASDMMLGALGLSRSSATNRTEDSQTDLVEE